MKTFLLFLLILLVACIPDRPNRAVTQNSKTGQFLNPLDTLVPIIPEKNERIITRIYPASTLGPNEDVIDTNSENSIILSYKNMYDGPPMDDEHWEMLLIHLKDIKKIAAGKDYILPHPFLAIKALKGSIWTGRLEYSHLQGSIRFETLTMDSVSLRLFLSGTPEPPEARPGPRTTILANQLSILRKKGAEYPEQKLVLPLRNK